MGEGAKHDRRENLRLVLREAGVSPAGWRVAHATAQTLKALAVVGFALFVVGGIVGGIVGGGHFLIRIGLAVSGGAIVLLIAMIPLDAVLKRRIEKVRWLDGTVMLRTVEPGHVGESGQHVVCEVELKPTARVVYEEALNPTARIARVSATVGPLDTERLVVGAILRCLIDRIGTRTVLRAFPYAPPNAPLPSGRELKFRRAKA